jgi:hypothetical protein
MRIPTLALVLVIPILTSHAVLAETPDKTALIGMWDYASYTGLENGKPLGTLNFKPNTMVFTYQRDGTWEMRAADATHTALAGTYELRGTELILKKQDGSLYLDFQVELKNDGKVIVLRDKRSIITASKLEASQ